MWRVIPCLAVGMFVLGVTVVRAADAEDAGHDLYVRYCGACHGPAGKGDGVASSFLRPKPIDLTQIAKKNGGTFPTQKVAEAIDGRATPRVHGDPAMPVWGEMFEEQAGWDTTRRAQAHAQVLKITNYIANLQEK